MSNKRLKTISQGSVEYAQFRTFRFLSMGMYFFFGCMIIGSLWFLYTRMYQTIGQVESLVALSPVASVKPLNRTGYENIELFFQQKNNQKLTTLTRDPFSPVVIVLPTTTEQNIATSTNIIQN